MTLNKGGLVDAVTEELGIPSYLGEKLVDTVFIKMKELLQENEIRIKNFGKFEIVTKERAKYKDFNTGRIFEVPSRKKLKFTASKNYFREVQEDDENTGGEFSKDQ